MINMKKQLNQIKEILFTHTNEKRLGYLLGLREGIYLAIECQNQKVDASNDPLIVEFAQFVEGEIDKIVAGN